MSESLQDIAERALRTIADRAPHGTQVTVVLSREVGGGKFEFGYRSNLALNQTVEQLQIVLKNLTER